MWTFICIYMYRVSFKTEMVCWFSLSKHNQHLMVLFSECGDYDSQELLQSCLHFSCEASTQGRGNYNGDAVSQQLEEETGETQ